MPHSEDIKKAAQVLSSEENEKELSEISRIIEKSDIDKGDKERIITYIHEDFSGPLPHPHTLKQYEEIHPGFAEEIIKMTINEQKHRQKLENAIVASEVSLNSEQSKINSASIKLKMRLQLFGFFLTTLLVIIGTICIFQNKNMGSIATFIFAIGSFCWTMFYGKKENSLDEKKEDEKNSNISLLT